MHGVIYGNGDRPIICLHGLSQTHKAFNSQLPLSDEFKVICPDLRGHGKSILEGEITIEQMATDVIELMDHLHIEQATILGVSLGTIVIQEIYKRHPHRIKAMILSNGYTYVPDTFLKMEIENRKNRLNSMSDEQYLEIIARKCSLSMNNEIIDKIKHTMNINRDTYLKCASSPIGSDFRDVVKTISVDTLVISGWWDIITPIALQYLQHRAIKGSKHVKFYCGHLPNIEVASEFNCELRKFLRGVYDGK